MIGRLRRAQRRLPENVRALGWVSLANDAASELAYPIVPLFLTITLGAPVAAIGLIEGAAQGVAVGLGMISGWLSDRQGERRRPWIVGGYGATTVARALLAAAPAWGWVLGARLFDRLGKAARNAPRDALIRDSSTPELRGASFGYHRAMDTTGAVIGPLLAVALLAAHVSLRTILFAAVVPGLFTMILLRRIREAPVSQRREAMPTGSVRALPRSFWLVLSIWIVFSLGNSSDVFLLLRSHELGLSSTLVVLAYAVYNLIYAGLSWPLGALSDRVPRPLILAGGLAVFAAVYLGFAVAPSAWAVWPLFAVYGVYIAATEGVARAWVGDHVSGRASGTAYGVFSAASGAALLLASVAAGLLWSQVSPAVPFYVGAGAAGLAAPLLLLLPTGRRGRG